MAKRESYRRRMAQAAWRRWMNDDYKAVTIWEAYSRPSAAKVQAWRYCEQLCEKYDGRGLVVLSANTFRFSAGFEFVDKETGVVSFMLIAPDYRYSVDTLTPAREVAAFQRKMRQEAALAAAA